MPVSAGSKTASTAGVNAAPAGIRPASPRDLDQLMALVARSQIRLNTPEVATARVRSMWLEYIFRRDVFTWVSDKVGGILIGVVETPPLSVNPVASNHIWLAEDGSGVALMRCFLRWADDLGLEAIVTTGSNRKTAQIARVLERLGALQIGTTHRRTPSCHLR